MGWFLVRRLRAHRLLVAATALTVLLTTCVLAALTGFASSVGDAGLRRALQSTDAAETPLMVSGTLPYAGRAAADHAVRDQARRAYPGLPVAVRSVAASGSYGLPAAPGTPAGADPDLTTFAALDRSRLKLLRGGWPGPVTRGAAIQVAVPAAAERRLGAHGAPVALGAVIALRDRLTNRTVHAVVSGVYRARNTGDPYWLLDPLGGKGTQTVTSTSYGPLLVQDGAFRSGALAQDTVKWQAVADFRTLTNGRTGALTAAVQRSVAELGRRPGFSAQSRLPDVLARLRRSVLVSRSTLLVGLLQLAALAAATLLLAARLLAEQRESENALLRSRGAAPRRIMALAAGEAVLLALPAALLAPPTARPLVGLLSGHGTMAAAGMRLTGPLPAQVWWVSAAAAAGCALIVLAPGLRRTGGGSEAVPGRRSRRPLTSGLLRGGTDLALVALAAAAYWQLVHYASGPGGSGVLTTGASGGPGIDPVLVAAPTLALCAGTVVTLRLLPPVARLAERLAARSRGLPAALAGWRIARSPFQGGGPVLLLALATAAGTLAVGQGASWTRSQSDQAAFGTGGDLRVVAASSPAFGQGGEFESVPGVASAVPVAREPVALGSDRSQELLALDTRAVRQTLPMRSDLTDLPVPRLLGRLTGSSGSSDSSGSSGAAPDASGSGGEAAVAPRGIPLPGRPRSLSLDVTAAARPSGSTGPAPELSWATAALGVTLTDRHGVGYALPLQTVPVDGRTRTFTFDLHALAGGTGGVPAYPLTLVGLSLEPPYAVHSTAEQTLTIRAVHADSALAPVPAGLRWATAFEAGAGQTDPTAGFTVGSVSSSAGPGALPEIRYDAGSYRPDAPPGLSVSSPAAATIRLSAAGLSTTAPLPAVATRSFLDATATRMGSALDLPLAQGTVRIRIAAEVKALPGTGPQAGQAPDADGPSGGALLVDLGELDRRLVAAGTDAVHPSEWWLTADHAPGSAARAAADLRGLPDVETVQLRTEVADGLRRDPLGLGPQTALAAVALASVLLAAVGFTVSAAGMLRRRAGEDAVLRAMGVRRRDLARAAAAELALPALLGIAVGLLLGVVLTRLVVPLLVLTAQGTRPLPPVLVELPAGRLALLAAAVAAAPLLIAAVAGRRGGDPARRLRGTEEL
ncbi:FtsX-like permease family protein [Streptacidiphilus griseoplanus]|uniref:FtsX-like permease family protein n=1 Tax=Peterkaempfera griseoplana TaxID=66896 RepID=UPI0006E25FE3|nr:FtsX-like permease family protein [Peterkaempfera griseoplana]